MKKEIIGYLAILALALIFYFVITEPIVFSPTVSYIIIGLIAVVLGVMVMSAGLAQAKDPQGRVVNSKTKTPTPATQTQQAKDNGAAESVVKTQEKVEVTQEERKKAAVAQQAATAEEQKIASQLRGLQLLMQKEEQALAQRLAYAAKIRAQGLASNDQKLLDQAERLERQALDYYQKRVKQFESFTVSSGQSNTKTKQQTTRGTTRSRYPQSRSSRSSSRSRTRR